MAGAAKELAEVAEAATVRAPRRRVWSRFGTGHVVMVGAGAIALVANLLVLNAAAPTTTIVVAATDLEPGQLFTADAYRHETIPVEESKAERFMSVSLASTRLGSMIRSPIPAGAPILPSDLVSLDAAAGSRTMSLAVPPERAVSGDLVVGDAVDVIAVFDGQASYIATGLEVVAVGSVDRELGRGEWSVTVVVSDDAGLRLASALAEGDVHVVRSTGAPDPAVTTWPEIPEPQETAE